MTCDPFSHDLLRHVCPVDGACVVDEVKGSRVLKACYDRRRVRLGLGGIDETDTATVRIEQQRQT